MLSILEMNPRKKNLSGIIPQLIGSVLLITLMDIGRLAVLPGLWVIDISCTTAKTVAFNLLLYRNARMGFILPVPPYFFFAVIRGESKEFPVLERHLLGIGVVMSPILTTGFREVAISVTLQETPRRCFLSEVGIDNLAHILAALIGVINVINDYSFFLEFSRLMERRYLIRIDSLLRGLEISVCVKQFHRR